MENTEKRIVCPNGDEHKNCYETYSKELNLVTYLCYDCGYTSNSKYINNKEVTDMIEQNTAQIIRELKIIDVKRNIVWYPSVIKTDTGIIFPEPVQDSELGWLWTYAPIEKISEEVQKDYEIPGRDGEYYESKIAIEKKVNFPPTDFTSACKLLGIVIDKNPEKNEEDK